jgi:hypothetical protein
LPLYKNNNTGTIFSCLDKAEIFYHSQQSPTARNGIKKSQPSAVAAATTTTTTIASAVVNVDQSFLKKVQPNYLAF